MSRHHHPTRLPALLTVAAIGSPLIAQVEPRSTDGDLGKLSCRVTKIERGEMGINLFQVEVKNRNPVPVEPVEFAVTALFGKDQKPASFTGLVQRATYPYSYRFGRPVPARGKNRYWLQMGGGKKAPKFKVRVVRASFHVAGSKAVPAAKIGVGEIEQFQNQVQGGSKPASRVRLDNPHPFDVDVVVRVTFTQPRDTDALLGVRVKARGSRQWPILDLPGTLKFERHPFHFHPIRVAKVRVVDWCFVGAGDPRVAAGLFRRAHQGWHRWSTPLPAVAGRFVYVHDRRDQDRPTRVECTGRFVIDAAGNVRVKATADTTDKVLFQKFARSAEQIVKQAFADVRRPSTDEILTKNQIRLVADGVIEIEGPGITGSRPGWRTSSSATGTTEAFVPNYSIRDGRIVADGDAENLGNRIWVTQRLGPGYVVVERHNQNRQYSEQFRYRPLHRLVVPIFYRQRFNTGASGHKDDSVRLDQLTLEPTGAVAAPAPPEGPGVALLRKAWDASWRYPAERRRLTAKVDIRTPGTDLVWGGQRQITGALELGDYRGFMMDRSGWRTLTFDPTKAGTLPGVLTDALSDRLLLWCFRDFNGRGDFDAVFSRVQVGSPNEAGVFPLRGASWRSITVQSGRVRRFTYPDGLHRDLDYTSIGPDTVVTRVRTGDEDLRIKFRRIGGTLVPVEMEFRHVFGRQWGPESIKLREVRLHER